MPLLLDQDRHFAVAADGLPRVGRYDDDSRHVLYLDGDLVRSKTLAEWAAPLPTDPTPEESAAAITARSQRLRLGALLALLHPELVDDAPLGEWVRE